MKHYNKKIVIFSLILSYVFCFLNINCAKAQIQNKISISVTEKSGQDLKDYQVLVDLNKDNFSFDSNKERLSFFDENNSRLNYWIESWDVSAKEAKVWVKIPELKASETKTIYMDLNGNDSPDGNATFDFFDDFEEGNLNKWKTIGAGSSSNTVAHGGSYSMKVDEPDDAGINPAISNNFSASHNIAVDFWFQIIKGSYDDTPNGARSRQAYYGIRGNNNNKIWNFVDAEPHTAMPTELNIDEGGLNRYESTDKGDFASNIWYHHKLLVYNDNAKWYLDSADAASLKDDVSNAFLPDMKFNELMLDGRWDAVYYDDVRVRQYTYPEPEVILGEDLSIQKENIVSEENSDGYLIKGKITSTFKEDIKNAEIVVYVKDPQTGNAPELVRINVDSIKLNGETSFELTVSNKDLANGQELYVVIDPDNKIPEGNKANNIAKTKIKKTDITVLTPLVKNIIFFVLFLIVIFICYWLLRSVRQASHKNIVPVETKLCLKCGMVLDKNLPKCPVCSSQNFSERQ